MTAMEPRGDLAALEHMDPAVREQAVTQYLERARDQLTLAVNLSAPVVAAVKAEIASVADMAHRVDVSKEIRDDALEMLRRAEYALGKAIRAGQERGEIRRQHEGGGPKGDYVRNGNVVHVDGVRDTDKISPSTFFKNQQEISEIYAVSDDVTPTEFDAALDDARTEGNLSRANVVRKIKGVKTEGLTPVEKLVKVRELAPTGRTSTQIAREIGCTEEHVRDLARRNNIEITADKVMGKHRRVDSNRVVQETVSALEGLAIGIKLVNFDDLDPAQAENWTASLTSSIAALNRLKNKIKETIQ